MTCARREVCKSVQCAVRVCSPPAQVATVGGFLETLNKLGTLSRSFVKLLLHMIHSVLMKINRLSASCNKHDSGFRYRCLSNSITS